MGRILSAFILFGIAAGITGCKADPASRAASEMDSGPSASVQSDVSSSGGPARTAPAPADTRPLIVCFGDSLTAGYGADEGQSYPDFLQKFLDRDGFHYRVVNEGVSGNTTKDGVDRLPGILAMHPAVVVVEFGGNDGLRGFKVPVTRANLETMISALKKAGSKVVVAGITLPPSYGADYVNDFTQTFPMMGRKYDVPVLPFVLQNVYGVDGMMQADGIHATDRGNQIVAKNVLPLVEAQLKR